MLEFDDRTGCWEVQIQARDQRCYKKVILTPYGQNCFGSPR